MWNEKLLWHEQIQVITDDVCHYKYWTCSCEKRPNMYWEHVEYTKEEMENFEE